MSELREYCRASDLRVEGAVVEVTFADKRKHKITVSESDEAFELHGFVARQKLVAGLADVAGSVWLRNRATDLVGFRIDRKGRLIGEAWIPKVGLTAEEFQFYVRRLAVECDRFEYLLTGKDME